ncbi:MAG: hypothetical protein ABIP97_01385, partial [Chthoniobacterales bacterium]
ALPPVDPSRGLFTLGSKAVLNVAGLMVDDRLTSSRPFSQAIMTQGGEVSIKSYSADLAKGSVIDASGGVDMKSTGKPAYGNGGSIAIQAGQDLDINGGFTSPLIGGTLNLASTLKGFSGGAGGSLTLRAPAIQIGGSSSNSDVLFLSPKFFNEGGFSSFTLSGIGIATSNADVYTPAILIAPGTIIDPKVQSWVAIPHSAGSQSISMMSIVKPEALQSPVSLTFNAVGVTDSLFLNILETRGDFILGEGAKIQAGSLGKVSINGDTVAVLGSIIAPGGSISITGAKKFPMDTALSYALPTVDLGPRSLLSVAGKTLLTPDAFGRRIGTVLSGGRINIFGNIVAEAGAVLDASGSSDVLDFSPLTAGLLNSPAIPLNSGLNAPLNSIHYVPVRMDSNGGSITLTGSEELFIDATLLGRAGGATAQGGSLIVSSGRFYPVGSSPASPLDVVMTVSQEGTTIPRAFYTSGQTAIGHPVLDSAGNPIQGMGYFSVDSFQRGGFDALVLGSPGGALQFKGPVTIDANAVLKVATGGVLFADSAVNLKAPYVALGTPFLAPLQPQDDAVTSAFSQAGQGAFYFQPTFGPGSLTVTARLIDIGNLSLQNIGRASFIAEGGDIRGDGTLDIAGDFYFRAAQIYPVTKTNFTIVAYYDPVHGQLASDPGRIIIEGSGTRQLPLSAGGTLSLYAADIEQGGTLRAPLGTINLGWDGTGTAPKDLITGTTLAFPVTQTVKLLSGSTTSVSAVDPVSGKGILIPYGLDLNDTSWIDPSGVDITAGGLPAKTINIAGQSVTTESGSVIDLRGGGDLLAYRWIKGNGGNTDILASNNSFAVIPGYQNDFAPYAAFNSIAPNLGLDPGYTNSGLSIGDRVYLDASSGLAAGVYTLLPARYALLPGAFLVTPQSGSTMGTIAMPDGSTIVSGYRFNDLNSAQRAPAIRTKFEVDSAAVVLSKAQYTTVSANSFLSQSALTLNQTVPRLPIDSGHLILEATQAMVLKGNVLAQAPAGGRGSFVDINSPVDILIAGPGVSGGPGVLTLDAGLLSSFNAESLLVGGIRQIGSTGTVVTVSTNNLTVDNAGTPLTGAEIILVAKKNLTVASDAEIIQQGDLSQNAETLQVTGDGALLRVSSDENAKIIRSGVTTSTIATMVIGAGAEISGGSVILDSSYATSLSPTAILKAKSISLNSGQISMQLNNPGTVPVIPGLMLSGSVLQALQSVQSLSLLSYSSIDIYGSGVFSTEGSLALHAGEIRGFINGGSNVSISATDILLDNLSNGVTKGAVIPANGTLTFSANTIRIGNNQLNIDQYSNVNLAAPAGILVEGTGGLATQGNLTTTASVITASKGVTSTISAGGALLMQSAAGNPSVAGGLGASLTLQGSSVTANSSVLLSSGLLTLYATGGNVAVGGTLDVSGTRQDFFDVSRYTDGGQVTLISDAGNVIVNSGGSINVSAQSGGGNAGVFSVTAPTGSFTAANGSLIGQGGANGNSGSLSLDVGRLAGGLVSSLSASLNGFEFVRSIRDRLDTTVTLDGTRKVRAFNLSADNGTIDVIGTVDASGVTGGNISLIAHGSLILESGSVLTVAAQNFSNAGKGGAVSLEAGAQTNGNFTTTTLGNGPQLDIGMDSTIDLSVAAVDSIVDPVDRDAAIALAQEFGNFTGTLHLRAPQTTGNTDLQIKAIKGTILNASSITAEGYTVFDLTNTGGTITNTGTTQSAGGVILSGGVNVQGSIQANGNLLGGAANDITNRLLANNGDIASVFVVQPGAEI